MKQQKLEELADQEGLATDDLIEGAVYDAACPGICMNPHCAYSTEVEPDQWAGWCEACEEGSVASCLILAGVI